MAVFLVSPSAALAKYEFAKLTPSGGSLGDEFGRSVGISGTTAIVGAYGDEHNGVDSGSAYLFDVSSGSTLAKLTPSDGEASDQFGYSVGISGNTAIVGARYDDDNGDFSGSVYLFEVATSAQLIKLTASDAASFDGFGHAVGISGNIAVVGAPWDDTPLSDSGSAYLFDVTTGSQLAKLTPNDRGAQDLFGSSVGINGNIAIVGAPRDGSAYLFDITTGVQLAKLTPSDGKTGDSFGASVAVNGNTAIVGAPLDDDNGVMSGSAYLFDVTTGAQLAKLTPSDAAATAWFGNSVGISDNTAIIGAFQDSDAAWDSGSAYLFDVTSGAEFAKLLASDGAEHDQFGLSVAISGSTAIVGALRDTINREDSGSAYLFDITIPEPSTLLLVAWASVGVLGWRRRRGKMEWQRGNSPDLLRAGDLTAWQSNYGAGAQSLFAIVPEPLSLAMAGCLVLSWLACRRVIV